MLGSWGTTMRLLISCDVPVEQDKAPGTQRGPCYAKGSCDACMTCASDVCVKLGDGGHTKRFTQARHQNDARTASVPP